MMWNDVIASHSGNVSTVVKNYGYSASSYGNTVYIETSITSDETTTSHIIRNCHLRDGDESIVVKVKQFVLAGKYLGLKGNTGSYLSGTTKMDLHLHYEVRTSGTHGNPNPFLPEEMRETGSKNSMAGADYCGLFL